MGQLCTHPNCLVIKCCLSSLVQAYCSLPAPCPIYLWVLPTAQVEFNMQTELRESFECSDASRSLQEGLNFWCPSLAVFRGTVYSSYIIYVHFARGDGSNHVTTHIPIIVMLMVEILKSLIYPHLLWSTSLLWFGFP